MNPNAETFTPIIKLPYNEREDKLKQLQPQVQDYIRMYIFKRTYSSMKTYTEYKNNTIYIHYETPNEYIGTDDKAFNRCMNDYNQLHISYRKQAKKILPYLWRARMRKTE